MVEKERDKFKRIVKTKQSPWNELGDKTEETCPRTPEKLRQEEILLLTLKVLTYSRLDEMKG